MIASRRCASPARPPGESHVPAPSGPRDDMYSRTRSNSSASTGGAPVAYANAPLIPHTCHPPPRSPLPGRRERSAWPRSLRSWAISDFSASYSATFLRKNPMVTAVFSSIPRGVRR